MKLRPEWNVGVSYQLKIDWQTLHNAVHGSFELKMCDVQLYVVTSASLNGPRPNELQKLGKLIGVVPLTPTDQQLLTSQPH